MSRGVQYNAATLYGVLYRTIGNTVGTLPTIPRLSVAFLTLLFSAEGQVALL